MKTKACDIFTKCGIILGMLILFTGPAKSNGGIGGEELKGQLHILESWLHAQMEYRNIPGIAVGIVHDGNLIYARGFGYENLETRAPVTPESLFRIASISKTFTATAVMQLRDAGKLTLENPIEKYLPGFNIGNPFPDAPEIRIIHLLTHTSGLPREAGFPYWTDRKFPTMQQILDKLPEQEMIYPPGTKYKYSNLGMALLGEIVSVVSGEPYDRYVTEHILKPLGMNNTYVTLNNDLKNRVVTPYSHRFPDGSRKIMPLTEARGLTPAANLTSNVKDLARYISMQLNTGHNSGNQVLNGYTLAEMHRVHWLNDNWTSGYGLGFRVWKDDDYTVVGHGGWVAGNRSQISFVPDENVGVVVLTNADDASPGYFAKHILDFIIPVLKTGQDSLSNLNPDPYWKHYEGSYSDPSWYDTEIFILNNRLVMNGYGFPPEDDPGAGMVRLFPEKKNVFRMSGPEGNGERVVFFMDENDRVVKIKVGENFIFPKKY